MEMPSVFPPAQGTSPRRTWRRPDKARVNTCYCRISKSALLSIMRRPLSCFWKPGGHGPETVEGRKHLLVLCSRSPFSTATTKNPCRRAGLLTRHW